MLEIRLKAHNGQYVCAEGGGGKEVVANRDKVDVWETFIIEISGDDAAVGPIGKIIVNSGIVKNIKKIDKI